MVLLAVVLLTVFILSLVLLCVVLLSVVLLFAVLVSVVLLPVVLLSVDLLPLVLLCGSPFPDSPGRGSTACVFLSTGCNTPVCCSLVCVFSCL